MSNRREELLALAERCEKASEADRELDARVAYVVRWRWDGWKEGHLGVEDCDLDRFIDLVQNSNNSIYRYTPAYTGSLDAAMTLVPEGCEWKVHYRAGLGNAAASVTANGHHHVVPASTPALALTAASLRALASQEITS